MILASSIEVVSDNLKLTIHMPSAVSGVIPFINQFNRLWTGTVRPEVFKKIFNNLKAQTLPQLADLAVLEDDLNRRIGHKLELCHIALNSKWNSPATATIIDNNDIFWESGQSRFLAGGLCWPDPWTEHTLMIFASDQSVVEPWLLNPTEIVNDCELSHYLGTNCSHKISTRLDVFNQQISYRLSSVSREQNNKEKSEKLRNRIDAVRQWVTSYPRGTKLNVHTSDASLIHDSIGYWDINYLKPEQPTIKTVHTFRANNNDQNVDLAELLVWMDTKYKNFVTADGKYLLETSSSSEKTKTIALSCL
jgi:hypothetical protein